MPRTRRRFSSEFKAKVAIEAIKGQRTLAELAGEHQVHANQITAWKKQLLESLPDVFGRRRVEDAARQEELVARLYQQIGQLKVELDWLKKRSGLDD
jgi:transposase-like protein